jgi:hypothetical protein
MTDSPPAMTKRILVIAGDTAGEQPLIDVIRSCAEGAESEVLVIASEPGLDTCLARLHAAGVEAHGRADPADPVQAAVEGLDGFPADEIVLATAARRWPFWPSRDLVERVRKRFAGTIFHVVLDPAAKARPSLATAVPFIPRLSERR